MSLFNFFRLSGTPKASSGVPEWDGCAFALDDPRVPAGVRARILADFGDNCQLYYSHTRDGSEWWLMDGDELLEVYWQE